MADRAACRVTRSRRGHTHQLILDRHRPGYRHADPIALYKIAAQAAGLTHEEQHMSAAIGELGDTATDLHIESST